jgi:hypothetical protein
MKRIALVFAAVATTAGCSDHPDPMGVDADVEELAAEAMAPPFAAVPAAALAPVHDVIERLLVALPNGQAEHSLRAALVELAMSLEAGHAGAVHASRRAAENALDRVVRQTGVELEADLAAIALAIESVH